MSRPVARRAPVDRLTESEASKARALVERIGAKKAAQRLGLADQTTLAKAVARFDVHRLTAYVVRSRLDTL